MIELTVDLALLYEDQARNERIGAWEMSTKCRHAQISIEYHRRQGSPALEETRIQSASRYLAEKRKEVERARRRWWEGQHPERWTRRTLGDDVRLVQSKYPSTRLGDVYELQYRIMCWTIHGSALAMTRSASTTSIVTIMGMALHGAATLALESAEFAARVLEVTGWQVRMQHAHEDWILRYGGIKVVR